MTCQTWKGLQLRSAAQNVSCAQYTSFIYVMGMRSSAWHVAGKHDMCRVEANNGAAETWQAHMES